jgi:hypothetical protein
MSDTARYYDETKNEGTPGNPAGLPGVPLRDLTQEEFDGYPAWLQASIDGSAMYRKTPLPPAKRAPSE